MDKYTQPYRSQSRPRFSGRELWDIDSCVMMAVQAQEHGLPKFKDPNPLLCLRSYEVSFELMYEGAVDMDCGNISDALVPLASSSL